MPIYRLEPVDRDSPHWQRSWHRDVCLVGAASEAEARELATAVFDQVVRHQGREPLVAPWSDKDLVTCTEARSVPDHMAEGMVALPDGLGGWQLRGQGVDSTEIDS